jgi:RNA polymerase sigma-70 factor (ECF subfamily)
MTDTAADLGDQELSDTKIAILVARAQQTPSAFTPLYDCYVQPIYCYLYSRLANAQEAEDLTAQTFLSALEALPRYRDDGHFSAWIFSIARNKAIDYFRKHKRETGLDMVETEAKADAPDLLAQVIQSQDVRRLSELISGFGEADQELIRLRYLADLSFAEMSVLLGKREDAVKKALYRLLARLESQMEAKND